MIREEIDDGSIARDPLPLADGRVRQVNASKGPHLRILARFTFTPPPPTPVGLVRERGEEGRDEGEEGRVVVEEEEEEEEEEGKSAREGKGGLNAG